MSNYDDIRPYNDSEVSDVFDSLSNNREFLEAIAVLKLSRLHAKLPGLARFLGASCFSFKSIAHQNSI